MYICALVGFHFVNSLHNLLERVETSLSMARWAAMTFRVYSERSERDGWTQRNSGRAPFFFLFLMRRVTTASNLSVQPFCHFSQQQTFRKKQSLRKNKASRGGAGIHACGTCWPALTWLPEGRPADALCSIQCVIIIKARLHIITSQKANSNDNKVNAYTLCLLSLDLGIF